MGFVWFWVWSFIWMWATVNGSHIWDRNNPCHDEDKRLHTLAEVSHICRVNSKREQRTTCAGLHRHHMDHQLPSLCRTLPDESMALVLLPRSRSLGKRPVDPVLSLSVFLSVCSAAT
mmetsp:Transcript_30698/g.66472  ORF Transcript_30698/g.66472 Transcript_30698/m.66472 type:complete len:117 (-) Transcript_30698:1435-1785(-)